MSTKGGPVFTFSFALLCQGENAHLLCW